MHLYHNCIIYLLSAAPELSPCFSATFFFFLALRKGWFNMAWNLFALSGPRPGHNCNSCSLAPTIPDTSVRVRKKVNWYGYQAVHLFKLHTAILLKLSIYYVVTCCPRGAIVDIILFNLKVQIHIHQSSISVTESVGQKKVLLGWYLWIIESKL